MGTPLPPQAPGGFTPPADPPKPADPAPAAPADPGAAPTVGVDFGDDVEKWKHFARQHEAEERRWRTAAETAQAELTKVQRANQSDAERAVSDARAEGEKVATERHRAIIARHALDKIAAQEQRTVSEAALKRLVLADLVDDEGKADEAALKEIVSGFAAAAGATPAAPAPPPPDPAQRGHRTTGQGGKPNPDDAMAAGRDLYRAYYPKSNN